MFRNIKFTNRGGNPDVMSVSLLRGKCNRFCSNRCMSFTGVVGFVASYLFGGRAFGTEPTGPIRSLSIRCGRQIDPGMLSSTPLGRRIILHSRGKRGSRCEHQEKPEYRTGSLHGDHIPNQETRTVLYDGKAVV